MQAQNRNLPVHHPPNPPVAAAAAAAASEGSVGPLHPMQHPNSFAPDVAVAHNPNVEQEESSLPNEITPERVAAVALLQLLQGHEDRLTS